MYFKTTEIYKSTVLKHKGFFSSSLLIVWLASHIGMDVVTNNTQAGCGLSMMFSWCAEKYPTSVSPCEL